MTKESTTRQLAILWRVYSKIDAVKLIFKSELAGQLQTIEPQPSQDKR